VPFRRRTRLQLLGFIDQRIHDVALAAFLDLLAQKLRRVLQLRLRPHLRDDLHAIARLLVDRRDLQIAVNRQRQRARDRRGRHHQHIRRVALADQLRPLRHAKLVLLVDDHDPRVVHQLRVMQQRMRADHDLWFVRAALPAHQFQAIAVLALRSRPQRHAQSQRFQPLPRIARMLLGQNLRWSHQHGLTTRFDRPQHRREGHHRFAAAHIAVQQAVHRRAGGHVAMNLVQAALLRRRELEGQLVEKIAQQLACADLFAPAGFDHAPLPPRHAELVAIELLQREIAPRLLQFLHARRKMHLAQRQRTRQACELALRARRWQQILAKRTRQRLAHMPRRHAQRLLRHRALQAVDRRDASRCESAPHRHPHRL
jgi:hypothetical protein